MINSDLDSESLLQFFFHGICICWGQTNAMQGKCSTYFGLNTTHTGGLLIFQLQGGCKSEENEDKMMDGGR